MEPGELKVGQVYLLIKDPDDFGPFVCQPFAVKYKGNIGEFWKFLPTDPADGGLIKLEYYHVDTGVFEYDMVSAYEAYLKELIHEKKDTEFEIKQTRRWLKDSKGR